MQLFHTLHYKCYSYNCLFIQWWLHVIDTIW